MASVKYTFSSTGAHEVEQAFRSIAKAATDAKAATEGLAKASAPAFKYNKVPGQGSSGQTPAERAAEREARKRERLANQAARNEQRRQDALMRQRSRQWNKEFLDQQRREKKLHQERVKMATGAAKWMGHRALGAAGALMGGASMVGGAALREGFELQNMASKLAVQGREPGKAAMSADTLRRSWEQSAMATPGAKASEIGSAVSQFVTRTGRLDIAQQWQDQMAEIMVATDTAGTDLGNTMATIFQKFGVESAGDMKQAFADLTFQGKKGAFELSDMAAYMAEIGAATERYGGLKGSAGLRKVGGLMQIARGSVGGGAEASTALQAMFRQIIAKAGDIKKGAKFDVWAKGKKGTEAKDINDVIVGTIAGFKGDKGKLQEVFDERGVKAVSPLIAAFTEVYNKTKDVSAGEAAMRDMMEQAATTGATWSDVQRDAAIRGETASSQLTTAWETVKATIGDSIPTVAKALSGFAQLLSSDKMQASIAMAADVIATGGEALSDAIIAVIRMLPKGDQMLAPYLERIKNAKARRNLKKKEDEFGEGVSEYDAQAFETLVRYKGLSPEAAAARLKGGGSKSPVEKLPGRWRELMKAEDAAGMVTIMPGKDNSAALEKTGKTAQEADIDLARMNRLEAQDIADRAQRNAMGGQSGSLGTKQAGKDVADTKLGEILSGLATAAASAQKQLAAIGASGGASKFTPQ